MWKTWPQHWMVIVQVGCPAGGWWVWPRFLLGRTETWEKTAKMLKAWNFSEQRLELKIYSYCFWMRDDHNDFAVYKSLGFFFSHTSRFQFEGLHFLTNYNCAWKRVVENRSLFHVLRNVNVWLERNFKIKVDEEELLTQEDLQWMTWHHVLIFSKSYLGAVLDSNLIKSKQVAGAGFVSELNFRATMVRFRNITRTDTGNWTPQTAKKMQFYPFTHNTSPQKVPKYN